MKTAVSRRAFLGGAGGLFTLVATTALVKAKRSDLLLPDRRIVTDVPPDVRRALVDERWQPDGSPFIGHITEVIVTSDPVMVETTRFGDSARSFDRGFNRGLAMTEIRLVGHGYPRAMAQGIEVVIA